jgi:hypothetical protein
VIHKEKRHKGKVNDVKFLKINDREEIISVGDDGIFGRIIRTK